MPENAELQAYVKADTAQITEVFTVIGKTVDQIARGFAEAVTPAFEGFKKALEQADFTLQPAWHHEWQKPVGKVDPGSGDACFSAAVAQAQAKYLANQPGKLLVQHKHGQQITAEQVAKAFDIPLSLVADPVVDQPVIEAVGVDLAVYGTTFVAKMSDGTIQHLSPTEVSVTTSPKKAPIVASGGFIAPLDHLEDSGYWAPLGTVTGFEPEPEHLEGDGDLFPHVSASYKPLVFDVLGKAQPVVVMPKPVSTSHWPADGTQHVGPDGAVWEFALKGGWVITVGPESAAHRALYGWWCSCCEVHWERHTADPVGCESGGWLRPATSAEHKRALLQS